MGSIPYVKYFILTEAKWRHHQFRRWISFSFILLLLTQYLLISMFRFWKEHTYQIKIPKSLTFRFHVFIPVSSGQLWDMTRLLRFLSCCILKNSKDGAWTTSLTTFPTVWLSSWWWSFALYMVRTSHCSVCSHCHLYTSESGSNFPLPSL